jgi:hypothetical protein
MTALGVIMALVGIAGALVNIVGIVKMTGWVGDPTVWGAIAAAGILLAIFTRRPRD